MENKFFSNIISYWYTKHKRKLPWRNTTDPYQIWVSEIILQQTKVAQGLPYFLKFMSHFPTIFDFANASEGEILKLWQGLGYYSRARNMHFTAKYITEHLDGIFPTSFEGLIKLKGIGEYTASAMASFCFGEPKAVVDGNVYRVLSRYFNIDMEINTSKGVRYFKNLAQEILDVKKPDIHNQAIMEFGALQCVPKKPKCKVCPLASRCLAMIKNKVSVLPRKLKKQNITKVNFHYLVYQDKKNHFLFEQRQGKSIWKNLYQFPLYATEKKATKTIVKEYFNNILENQNRIATLHLYNKNPIIHKLTHKHIKTSFWIAKTTGVLKNAISSEEIKSLPVPVLIDNFMKEFGI